LYIRFDAGRCLLIGFWADEEKWGHLAPLRAQAAARQVSQPLAPGLPKVPSC
jgi:hypothetical protein